MAAASSSFCPNRTLSLSAPSQNPNQLTSLHSLLRFPASSSPLSSRCRLSLDSNNRNLEPRLKVSAALVMEQPTSSSPTVPEIVEVDLGNRSYPIYIGSGLLNQPELLQRHVHGKQVLVVTNTTIAPLYLDKTIWALTDGNPNIKVESVILPDGEQFKNMETLMKVFDKAIESRMDRRCTFVALGGGVIGDMCGYAAASFLRGVNFIQIPTTVMAQEKNMYTLMARDPSAFAYAIKRSCENKAEVVSLDEKESGLRATLNLGHTFGHAIETGLGYGQWLHGEAVAAGTVMAVDMSHRLGWIDDSLVKRVHTILQQAKLPTAPPETMTVDMFKSVMAVDKKVADGLLRLILLKGSLGNCVFTGDYDRQALDDTLHAFCKS
ncbi:hypothetical protein DH2020_015132 [Rehmannia glutinosa]|uniref:3-dehydroquinate synthase C-terminal domain-containing protein n=1 Tax=Rehmannia glutinosa TaxID=99300 RepID=A0ABR0WYJ1_REHGL